MSSKGEEIPAHGSIAQYQANVEPAEAQSSDENQQAEPTGDAAREITAQAAFSLSDAEQLSPKRIQNRIVRDVDNLSDSNSYLMNEAFPLYQMGDYEEVYHRLRGLRLPMPSSSLVSESSIAGLEGLSEDKMNITTLKEKISPEKAVSTILNANAEIADVAEMVSTALRTDMMTSRSLMAWRGYNDVPGMIGTDGLTSHPDLQASHTLTGSDFSPSGSADIHGVFSDAVERISKDGSLDGDVGPITAYIGTDTLWDLFRDDNLESRLSGVEVQSVTSASQLEAVLPVDNVVEIRTDIARTDASGQPLDSNGNVVSVDNAAEENILEPIDPSDGVANRNIVVGAFGRDSGVMPWFVDRLADHIGSAPQGRFSMNMNEGFLMQGWTQNDPVISWRKLAQEIGLELVEPDNYVVLQDV